MNLSEKLSKIQVELKVAKTKTNKFGGYKFRSAEDILEALKPLNDKYGVYFIIREELISDAIIKSEATIFDLEGSSISSTAIVGVDLNQKGMATAQQYGSASSYGKKYALGNLLLIDDTADADATNTHGKTTTTQKAELKENSEAFVKVVTALKSGKYTVADVKAKYVLSSAIESKLANL
jgi:hypothetical protein